MTHLLLKLNHKVEYSRYFLLTNQLINRSILNTLKKIFIIVLVLLVLLPIYSTKSYAEENKSISQPSENVVENATNEEAYNTKEEEVLVNSNNGMRIAFIIIGLSVIIIPIIIVFFIIKWFIRRRKKL